MLICLLIPVAASAAGSQDFTVQALLARMALQQAQLTAADGASWDYFGASVAISGDTAVVGAYRATVGVDAYQGSAYVFTRSGSAWSQQQKLTAADGAAGDQFGYSVAISGDTAVVGAIYGDVGANANQGSAYVFTRSGSTWSQQQKLTAGDGAASDFFGYSIAISGDTAVVGASGSAYVFTRSGSTWSQQQKLTAADGPVAISGDTVVVGGGDVGVFPNNQGSVNVFTRSGSTWSQQQKLTAADGAYGDQFGYSVAISGDTVVVGAYYDDVGFTRDQGSAYVFTRSGSAWSQHQKLTAADGVAYDHFGYSIAISGDTVVVGAAGRAYVFAPGGSAWSQQQKLTAAGGPVAISGDTAVVGDLGGDGAIANQGLAYVFIIPPPPPAPTVTSFLPASGPFGTSVTITGTILTGATAVSFNGTAAASFTPVSDTQVTATVPAGATTGTISVTAPTGTGTSAASFAVIPAITSFTPASGLVGTSVTITGGGFGVPRGTSFVKFGAGKCSMFSAWSATQIKCEVPAGATTGTISVTTTGGTGTSAASFTVTVPPPPTPHITRLTPTAAHRRVAVVITGTGFGTKRGTTSFVKFGATKCGTYLSWSRTRIKCRVPAKARFGLLTVKVTTAGGTSNGKGFRVRR